MIKKPELYADKFILAPMVRTNSLPFRLLCLKYGADLVYTEELIDYRLSKCRRMVNKVLHTVDYVDPQGEIILRTSEAEKDKLILQIGSNNAERAIKAAQLVAPDIVGLDFNFGCPKSFSLSGGMGAALLEKPNEIKTLLTKSVLSLNIPVTCKIRILPELSQTLELVKLIEECGVSAIAVHGRTKDQRSNEDNQDEVIKAIVETVKIPVIANGGSNEIYSYSDMIKFRERTGASSVMIGRSAMRNPSIFKSDNDRDEIPMVIKKFLMNAVLSDTYTANVKYVLQTMMACGHYGSDAVHEFHMATGYDKLCDIFNMAYWYGANKLTQPKSQYYDKSVTDNDSGTKWLDDLISKKRETLKKQFGGTECGFVSDSIPFNRKIYPGKAAPKSQLHDYILSKGTKQAQSEVFIWEGATKGRFLCFMCFQKVLYLNKSHSISKKAAEHATAMIICERLGLVNLTNYKTQVNACSKNIT